MPGMEDDHPELTETAARLSDSVDALAGHVLDLTDHRSNCDVLADHYADFARRMESEYPSLAGPAGELAKLFRELDGALDRLGAHSETVIGHGGLLADRAAAIAGKQPGV
jgi:hypothetical protein